MVVLAAAGTVCARGVRVEMTRPMVSNESPQGDAWLLFDEPPDGPYPPTHEPATQWHPGWAADAHPAYACVDLGVDRAIVAMCLFDTNGSGDFVVWAGRPGAWREVLREPCGAYKQWRNRLLNVRTRYLRFGRMDAGANINEVVIFEQSPQDRQARAAAKDRPLVDAGPLFGPLPLADEIDCGDPEDGHIFRQEPRAGRGIETILGRSCRVLAAVRGQPSYLAFRLGKGKLLEPGRPYVLEVEYPQDRPRTMWIGNRGCETEHGLHTGPTVGDALHPKYVSSNPESLEILLSGRYEPWRMLFFMHDRFADIEQPRGEGPRPMEPNDGFWVIFSQPDANSAPLSAGLAVSRIRLFDVPDLERLHAASTLPDGLPKRRLFFREEMGDGTVASAKEDERGVRDEAAWFEYKARLMKVLGMNTYCKDLLEFGHNQGWDSGTGWYNQSRHRLRWRNILAMLQGHDLDVLPYYEYCGSIGPGCLGSQRRCVALSGGRQYTHISWSENANADITDPDTLADAKKLLDYTIVRHKDRGRFVGAWFRPRPSAIPISFSDRCLNLFAEQANGAKAVTREQLKADVAMLNRYYDWWFEQRKTFLTALRDHLRIAQVTEDPLILYTTDASESGLSFAQWNPPMVAENPEPWRRVGENVVSLQQVLAEDWYGKALTAPRLTWGDWEWQHSCPPSDPQRYSDLRGVLMTYTFNRAYTVASAENMQRFTGPSGLAMIRHWCLNEDMLDGKTGYFVCDVDRAGPYCMLAEARAMANGDPWYIGYLSGGSFNRGDIEYVRRFNQAFLSLPALPSRVLPDACADKEVVVRAIETPRHEVYLAVVNTGYRDKTVEIALPGDGEVQDAVTGRPIPSADKRRVRLSLYPCQLHTLRMR